MSLHTDLQGVDEIVNERLSRLEDVLVELRLSRADAQAIAGSVQAANILRELVVATRRNDELRRAERGFRGMVGERGSSVLMLAFLRQLQKDALRPKADRTPLPAGVATPIPSGDEDDEAKTVPPAPPVNPIEVDATADNAPTRPVKPVQGPWDPWGKGRRRR